MTIEKITVQKVFPIAPYMNVKIGLEASVDKEEDVKVAITEAEEILNDWFNNSYPNVGEPIVYNQVQQPVEDHFSGPIPQKRITRNDKTPVKMPAPQDIRVRYATAVARQDYEMIANLERTYDFTINKPPDAQ